MNTQKYNWKQVLIAGMFVTGSILTGCESSDYKTRSIENEAPAGDATTMDSTQGNPVDEAMTSRDNVSDKPVTNPGTDAATNPSSVTRKKGTKGRASIRMTSAAPEKNSVAVKDADGIYSRTDVMPMFPGGEAALQKFVEDNIDYPEEAIEQGAEGDIRVAFTVDEKGKVTNVKAIDNNKTEYGMKEEAIAVMNKMPAWTPGTVKGKKVKTRMQLPISFQIIE
ncbi:energy transducer TonB [Paraflavitalea soli]|uniref:Energy transducer TonB n=1 Tax=Paraflavitalea soli TaxID=2315862 RepID=A0A3B7MMX7_9BACT|nr:energy transducer TonB [Paraflavitalea soli]AXY72975.1 energy transducer TonB [Paraflavitalea soli]